MTPTLTIVGLYNYDPTLFDTMVLPEYVRRETLVNNLLGELFENEVIYPDAEMMKTMIYEWSRAMIGEWEKIYDTLEYHYNAVGLTETSTEERNLMNNSVGSSDGSSLRNVAGFNNINEDNTMVPSEQDSSSLSSTTSSSDTGSVRKTRSIYGLVNGKTSAEIIESEILLRDKYDIYSIIINEFKQRFCLMVY